MAALAVSAFGLGLPQPIWYASTSRHAATSPKLRSQQWTSPGQSSDPSVPSHSATMAAAAAFALPLLQRILWRQRKAKKTAMSFMFNAKTEAAKTEAESMKVRGVEALKLKALGGSSFDKALQVNLDPTIYGSFAEIGAGQEVSRTFLQAGAAAGTVAKSVSAYDMQMSDALYGSSKRYVTKQRVIQMMDGEYKDLENYVREGKAAWGGRGPMVRFFSFAGTLAAKAYMSDRECEGWIGLMYQHEAGAKPSTVCLHVRMSDPTAQQQGEAIGVLGTNLIYLLSNSTDPFVVATYLQDGLSEGRLEVDYMSFEGPGFPEGSFDPRLLAARMVQFRLTPCVMLEPGESGTYQQVVPNDAMYKTPVIVQRSRFLPVTNTHKELMEAAERQISATIQEGSRAPKCILDMQIEDMVRPPEEIAAQARISRLEKFIETDADKDGQLTIDELKSLLNPKLSDEDKKEIVSPLDFDNRGKLHINYLTSISNTSLVARAFLDRFDMLEPLKFPVMLSALQKDQDLATYLARYTNQQVTVVVGGGGYSIERGLYNSESYADVDGGMLVAFGKLFSRNVKILQYPNITMDGAVKAGEVPGGSAGLLHKYLVEQGHILPIGQKYMCDEAFDSTSNKAFCGGSREVTDSIKAGNSDWETYVPPEVVEIIKKRDWFVQVSDGSVNPMGMILRYLQNM